MEKNKCKLCNKSFANGRALGGHMRSHMVNLQIQQKLEQPPNHQLGDNDEGDNNSASSSSFSSSDEEEEDKGSSYGLRENPKKSFRFADPEFAFAVDTGSVVLQDRESETESSKNQTRRRSKRVRKVKGIEYPSLLFLHQREQEMCKKVKCPRLCDKMETWVEPEQVSSVSDTTTEEDVAFCLMMLSRDKWMREDQYNKHEQEQEGAFEKMSEEFSYESEEIKLCKAKGRGKYRCETCDKVFRSYQALGGHRASHKKMRVTTPLVMKSEFKLENAGANNNTATVTSNSKGDQKVHECPVCYRVFSSGQALGGHKRSHVIGSATLPVKNSIKLGENLIDLNLPAPIDDDDVSQIELSAVSDAEFVNHVK